MSKVQRLLTEAARRRNSARWAIALALGLRQGEALGLKWPDVDLDAGLLRIRRGRLRPKYEHGCGATCGRKAGYCPDRVQVRPDTKDVKSRAGRRVIGLPDPPVRILRHHREVQDKERVEAAQLWREAGWVFATPTGGPLNPNTDYQEWKELLQAAGLRDARLHDARHTAATVLLLLGVPDRVVMGIMGWSSESMRRRYQHLTDPILRDVATRLGLLPWEEPPGPADRSEEGN
nr:MULTISPECIES: site-specific integrase [Protofrankia]